MRRGARGAVEGGATGFELVARDELLLCDDTLQLR